MNTAIIFTNGGFLAEAIDASRGLAPQHNTHVYQYRGFWRDRNEEWCNARVRNALIARRTAEDAQWALERMVTQS